MKYRQDFLELASRFAARQMIAGMHDKPCDACACVTKETFVTIEGHVIKVFNDADYIERLTWPDGESVDNEMIDSWVRADAENETWETAQAEEEILNGCEYLGDTCKACAQRRRVG
jgi:hypothetical protein